MNNRNPRIDPRNQPDDANAGGVRAPIKGESSSSDAPIEPEALTLADHPATSRDAEAPQIDGEATLVDGALPPLPRGRRSVVHVSVAALQPGDVLGGRYEVLQLLGEGGMGAVYKARDRELDRFVALKVIRPELASNPAILARFKQELLLAHQVTHRNVIRIYDLSESEGMKFITMEFVEGENLLTLIHQKKK